MGKFDGILICTDLDGTLMNSFHCKDSSLYDFFNTMKEAYYNND